MEAVLFIGVQAAGKSTFYTERFFRTHVRINLDMLKTRHREEQLLRACIAMQQSFVVDNTHAKIEQRARSIAVARAAGFQIIGYYFRSEVRECLRRNDLRPPEERVPALAILGTARQMQLPSLAEGFDQLCFVRHDEVGRFVVEEWRDAL